MSEAKPKRNRDPVKVFNAKLLVVLELLTKETTIAEIMDVLNTTDMKSHNVLNKLRAKGIELKTLKATESKKGAPSYIMLTSLEEAKLKLKEKTVYKERLDKYDKAFDEQEAKKASGDVDSKPITKNNQPTRRVNRPWYRIT